MAKHHIRPISIVGNLAYVPLTKGLVAIVDAEDAHLVSGDNWQADIHKTSSYAARSQWCGDHYEKVKMHRVIMAAPVGLHVDHIDGDGLNNRRRNLRLATNQQNCWNQRVAVNNTSGHRGVHYNKKRGVWQAVIRHGGDLHWLGRHGTIEEAKSAYAAAAKRLFGEFARVE